MVADSNREGHDAHVRAEAAQEAAHRQHAAAGTRHEREEDHVRVTVRLHRPVCTLLVSATWSQIPEQILRSIIRLSYVIDLRYPMIIFYDRSQGHSKNQGQCISFNYFLPGQRSVRS